MRIAYHIPRASYLEPGLGGDRVQVPSLRAGLQERGHEVEIVSRLNTRDFWRGRLPARRLVAEALSVRMQMRRFAPEAWLVYNPSVKNPDLFGWWQHPGRYVLAHADPGGGTQMPPGWRRLFRFAHRRSLARADQVTAYHPASADGLRSLVAAERLHLIPPAIRSWDRTPSREEARQHLGLPPGAPILLCVSRLTLDDEDRRRPGKTAMIRDLMAAVAPLPPDVVLVVAGDGPGRGQLEDEIARLKPEGRIRLAGTAEHEELPWFYAACDFFAYPYAVDRPWMAILEAQSCGRPVVAMRTRSAELTVESGLTGLLARDLPEFQTHVAALASDRARCEIMGQAAREYVAQSHTMETRVRQFEALLGSGEGCLDSQPTRPEHRRTPATTV